MKIPVTIIGDPAALERALSNATRLQEAAFGGPEARATLARKLAPLTATMEAFAKAAAPAFDRVLERQR